MTERPTEVELKRMGDRLFQLEIEKRQIEEKQKELRQQLLEGMDSYNLPKLVRDGFYIIRSEQLRYDMPEPFTVRRVLGALADKYIHEVVDSSFRLAIPPKLADELCPLKSRTPYISLKIRGNGEE